jgi:hypothetical protein
MCQLNLLLVNEKVAEDYLADKGYNKIFDDITGYKAYQRGHCNCGSVVGSASEHKNSNLKYDQILEKKKEKELETLYQVRDIMFEPDYIIKKQEFEKKRYEYTKGLEELNKHILDYETEQLEKIEECKDRKEHDEKLSKLYEKLDELFLEMGTSPEYLNIWSEFNDFLTENEIMEQSTLYYLNEEEEEQDREVAIGIPLCELLGEDILLNDEYPENRIEIEEPSRVITTVISQKESEKFTEQREEYETIYEDFEGLLETVAAFRFVPIWNEPNQLHQVKELSLKALQIDDLAFLDMDEMLYITRG